MPEQHSAFSLTFTTMLFCLSLTSSPPLPKQPSSLSETLLINMAELSGAESDASSTLSELEAELEGLLGQLRPSVTSKEITDEVDQIVDGYAEHGTKRRLQASISKVFDKPRQIHDLKFDRSNPSTPQPASGERMTDSESAKLVTSVPFRLGQSFKVPPNITIPPEIVGEINKIYHLLELEGQTLLDHYCEKYGEEAIFRTGLRSLLLT